MCVQLCNLWQKQYNEAFAVSAEAAGLSRAPALGVATAALLFKKLDNKLVRTRQRKL